MLFPIRTNNRKGAVCLGKRGKTSSQWNCCRQFHGGLSADNMPAVNAIKTLEGLDEDLMRRNTDAPTPGIVLRIVNMAPQPVPIDITPRPSPIIDAGD